MKILNGKYELKIRLFIESPFFDVNPEIPATNFEYFMNF